jgi:hypothetical protein
MSTHTIDVIARLIEFCLLPLILALIARRYDQSQAGKALAGLTTLAGEVVLETMDEVRARKDPDKPTAGAWSAEIGEALKRRAMLRMKAIGSALVQRYAATLRDPSKVDDLLSTLIEAAVEKHRPLAFTELKSAGSTPNTEPVPDAPGKVQ